MPALYEELRAATATCENVTTYPLALGESKGVAPMWVGSGSGGQDGSSSLLEPKDHLNVFPEVAFEPGDAVEVTTLADWANRERIERIDGMWLDLQGYELAALRGAGDLIGRLSALILEISAQELYAAAPLWPEVRAWLETAGFEIVAEHWHHSGASGDALAVRRPSARAATASY